MRIPLISIALAHTERIALINPTRLLNQHRSNIATRLQGINGSKTPIWHGIRILGTLRRRLPEDLILVLVLRGIENR